jgi:hypothetical protein
MKKKQKRKVRIMKGKKRNRKVAGKGESSE